VFSSRLPWHSPRNELTQRLERKGGAAFDLTESNPTRAGIAYNQEAILAALGDPRSLVYEPSSAGLASAREAVARYCGASPEHVLLTASSSEAYSFLFKLLCDPGDGILVPRPSYPLFEFLASLEAVAVKQYPLRYQEGWWIDTAVIGDLISPCTKAIVVVNPNNPTGSYVKPAELTALESFGLPIISDEVFADYAFEPRPSAPPATFTLGGFSKLLGLPQMKLGWIVTRDAEARKRLELIADTFLSVSAPVQHAAAKWFELREPFQAAMMARLEANLAWLRAQCEPLRVEGGWYATLRLPRTRTEEEWAISFLEEDDVLVQPGYFYDFETEAFAVVSLLTKPEIFREGISRILRRIDVGTLT
jgi:aspartate/methionine/tyrosine aminotransferase